MSQPQDLDRLDVLPQGSLPLRRLDQPLRRPFMEVPQAVSAALLPSVTAEPSRAFIPRTWIVPTHSS